MPLTDKPKANQVPPSNPECDEHSAYHKKPEHHGNPENCKKPECCKDSSAYEKIDLSNVTLVCYENKDWGAALSLISEMLKLAKFGGVLWRNWHRNFGEFCHAENYGTVSFIHTSHYLTVHLDGYIIHPECWDPSWLQYDYIGAPWRSRSNVYAVGNGGFCLRSRRLFDRVAQLQPVEGLPPDMMVCNFYRKQLEEEEFLWAPVEEAAKFSVEEPVRCTPKKTFGFHGTYAGIPTWSKRI